MTEDASRRAQGWREPILDCFQFDMAAASRLAAVADPDDLLAEPLILDALGERGFDVVAFEDPLAFRFALENRFRRRWDEGEGAHLVVVLRTPAATLDDLPYDVIEQARHHQRCFTFTIAALFPNRVPGIVSALDRDEFDVLFDAGCVQAPGRPGGTRPRTSSCATCSR